MIIGCFALVEPFRPMRRQFEAIVKALLKEGFDGPTTLEIAGTQAVLESARRLETWAVGSSPMRENT